MKLCFFGDVYKGIDPVGFSIQSRATDGFKPFSCNNRQVQVFDFKKSFDMIRCEAYGDKNNVFPPLIPLKNFLTCLIGIGPDPFASTNLDW